MKKSLLIFFLGLTLILPCLAQPKNTLAIGFKYHLFYLPNYNLYIPVNQTDGLEVGWINYNLGSNNNYSYAPILYKREINCGKKHRDFFNLGLLFASSSEYNSYTGQTTNSSSNRIIFSLEREGEISGRLYYTLGIGWDLLSYGVKYYF